MSWAFPNRRIAPALAAALAYLVTCTAQRGLLLALVRGETGASASDALRVMLLGTQADLAMASALALPFASWAVVVPQRAWATRAHRGAVFLALGVAMLGVVLAATLETFYFIAHRTRLGPGSRPRVEAMLDFMAGARGGAPLIIAAFAALAVTLIAVALIVSVTRRALDAPRSAVGARLRDALLLAAVLAFFATVVATREPEFPGRRTLRELSGNGLAPVARVAWQRLPASWKRLLPRRAA